MSTYERRRRGTRRRRGKIAKAISQLGIGERRRRRRKTAGKGGGGEEAILQRLRLECQLSGVCQFVNNNTDRELPILFAAEESFSLLAGFLHREPGMFSE